MQSVSSRSLESINTIGNLGLEDLFGYSCIPTYFTPSSSFFFIDSTLGAIFGLHPLLTALGLIALFNYVYPCSSLLLQLIIS